MKRFTTERCTKIAKIIALAEKMVYIRDARR